MYSAAEDPTIEAFLDDQADKLGSYDEAWRRTEARFDVVRPYLGHSSVARTVHSQSSYEQLAEEDGKRFMARQADAADHARNNRLTHQQPDTPAEKAAQQAINARHRSIWQDSKGI